VNVNRDVLTADGWWLATGAAGPSDKSVGVTRFDDLSGNPIAVLVNYSVQCSVGAGSTTPAPTVVTRPAAPPAPIDAPRDQEAAFIRSTADCWRAASVGSRGPAQWRP